MRRYLLLILLCAGSAWCAADEVVVIASDVAALKPGAVLDGSAEIEIPAGSSATLVSSRGRTISLRGPYRGAPDASAPAADTSVVESLSRLLGESSGYGVLAVFRQGAAQQDLFAVNVERSGTYCVRERKVELHRRNAAGKALLSLGQAAGGKTVRQAWPKGDVGIPWPADLPLTDGGTYLADLDDGSPAKKITVRILPGDLTTDAHRAAWMADNNCQSQARRLVQSLIDR